MSRSRCEILRGALEDALDGLEDMFPYVPEFFREKWEHQGYIDRARAALQADSQQVAGDGGVS